MKSLQILLLLCTFGVFCSAQETFKPVKISVYYSVYCDNCRAFFTAKFGPYYERFKSWIDLDLIPFGNSTHKDEGNFEFDCENGPDECVANKWHTCANWIYKARYPEEVANFVNCTLWRDDKFFDDIADCAEKFRLDFLPIQHCVNEIEGSIHLAANAARTREHVPEITSYPTIDFNGTFDQDLQDLAVMDFKAAICSLIKNPDTGAKPDECNGALMMVPFYSVIILALGLLLRV
ncbi:GILT-like protein 1 [Cloeon dipterum]|uniref:GILT-like protein 1 n=1 Tax=Cloeon dipterum TaxID=197152 RepID=UPI00321FE1A8